MQDNLFQDIHKPNKIQQIRIPYQGSKRTIATQLIDKMLEVKPNAKYFYDLCGGGGSVSFTALQYGFKVHYNELQTSLVEFLEYTLDRVKNNIRSEFGIFPEEWYNFVSREEFFKQKPLQTPYSQFVRICYSFANNQNNFAFHTDTEMNKRLGHNIVVFQCETSLKKYNEDNGTCFTISNKLTWNERRLDYLREWRSQIKANECYKEVVETNFVKNHAQFTSLKKKQWLETAVNDRGFEHLERLMCLERLENLERLEKLEQTERLVHLENLENIETPQPFTISSLDFKDVKITTPPEESILYIDPPYRGTGKYIEGKDINYKELDEWFANNQHTVFMSEYNAPFEPILEIPKMKLMKSKGIDKRTYAMEKLFWNGK